MVLLIAVEVELARAGMESEDCADIVELFQNDYVFCFRGGMLNALKV